MVVADLHVHTTRSDGSLTLDALPAVAADAGVDAVAVTDHDRVQPALDGPVTTREGVTIVHGIELRVDTGGQRLDLLGYGVDPTDALSRSAPETFETAEDARLTAYAGVSGKAIGRKGYSDRDPVCMGEDGPEEVSF